MKNIKTTIQTLDKCNSGSKYAASIGGGYGDGSGMKEITIYGGKVTAQGAQYGADIGGGKNNNHPSTINIYGGTVNATGGEYGAGIGGGQNRGGWNTNTLHSSLQEGWYSLDGRRLAAKPTQRGIYINNGNKVIIQ